MVDWRATALMYMAIFISALWTGIHVIFFYLLSFAVGQNAAFVVTVLIGLIDLPLFCALANVLMVFMEEYN